jgi:hypothetical protein
MNKYEKVGSGSYDVYRKKKGTAWPVVVAVFVILFIIGTCAGADEDNGRLSNGTTASAQTW